MFLAVEFSVKEEKELKTSQLIMGFENVCLACLATDVKMYNLNKLFHKVYSNLTGITCVNDPYYICYECTHVLLNIERFRSQCLRAYETLTRTEHAQHRTTWHHEPRLKLTETKVLYFGPDHIVWSDTDADDNDVKEAKPFHSGLIHAIKSDTDAQVYDTVLKPERNNIHGNVNPLNIKQNAVFIEPAIREMKVEFESEFNHSECVDRFACDIKTQESQDIVNIEDKTKSKSVKKEGKSKPARKRQIKTNLKRKLDSTAEPKRVDINVFGTKQI